MTLYKIELPGSAANAASRFKEAHAEGRWPAPECRRQANCTHEASSLGCNDYSCNKKGPGHRTARERSRPGGPPAVCRGGPGYESNKGRVGRGRGKGGSDQVGARGRQCKAEALTAPVELHVELPHENVAQDPQGLPEVDRLQAEDTEAALGVEHKVPPREREVLPAERKGKRRDLRVATDDVQALQRQGAEHRDQRFHLALGPREQRGARIDDGPLGGGQR